MILWFPNSPDVLTDLQSLIWSYNKSRFNGYPSRSLFFWRCDCREVGDVVACDLKIDFADAENVRRREFPAKDWSLLQFALTHDPTEM